LTEADKQVKGAEAKLKAVGDRLEAAGVKGADPAKGIDTLAAERAAADKTLSAIVDRIALANVRVERKDVLKGVDRVVETALVNDPKGELMASREEIRRLGGVLAERRTPQEMLDIWLPILADRNRKDEAPKATVDAERVRNDDRATAVAKKKALAVLGLARRDLGDYEQARTLLGDALAGPGPKADWQAPVAAALKELTDPAAYYLPRARTLYEEGKYKDAMLAIIEARKLFPKETPELLVLDSLIQLDLAREKGKIDPASPGLQEAKASAEKAAAAGSADGHYALGRINEELGNLAEAKASYAKALAAHGDNDEAGARYRLALARVLKLQALKAAAGGRAAAPVRSVPVANGGRLSLTTLLLLVEIGMQPAAGADPDEAAKLLHEVLNAKDGPDTFMLKAQALALQGMWTQALKTYVAGLRPHIRRDYADGLDELVERHPKLRRPEALERANPLLAEARYSSGLRHYFARHYAEAETAFLDAIKYDDQDARFFYFLGLSRLALNRPADAEADFQEGAQLEQQNRPGREAVSTALERVQGTARQTVNRFRP
jgi:tetratricopeptide (TPR) repeat protein